jgi:hypothetical protein
MLKITQKGYWRVTRGAAEISKHTSQTEAFESASRNLPCTVQPPEFDCAAAGSAPAPAPPPAPVGFRMFDSMLGVTGKPSLVARGLLPMSQHNGDQGWGLGGDQSTPVPSQAEFDAAVERADAIVPFAPTHHFLDFEGFWTLAPWTSLANSFDSAAKFTLAAQRHRAALNKGRFASQKFGYYMLPVDSYWAFNGDAAALSGTRATVDKFVASGFGAAVDFIALSHYTFYDDRPGWLNHIRGAIALMREKFPTKPVYVFLWPRWHDSSATPFAAARVRRISSSVISEPAAPWRRPAAGACGMCVSCHAP